MDKELLLEKIISSGRTSKITHWTVENFGQFPNERWDFDEDGIIVFKAMNSVGKSRAIGALRAALTTAWVASGKARKFIRHNETNAKVNVFFDDGVEIEYVMNLSSLLPRAKFTNGYHLYLHKGDKRIEVYNTLQNGRYVTVKETPLVIKRYLNLAEMDGKYLNIMRKSEGLMILDQTPKALMKSLSKVANLETVERAINRINKDNKETLDELRAGDTRIRLFSNEIDERKHLTTEVMGILLDLDSELDTNTKLADQFTSTLEVLKDLSSAQLNPTLDEIPTKTLGILAELASTLTDLNDQNLISELTPVSVKQLELLQVLNSEILALDELEFLPSELSQISARNLDKLLVIENEIDELTAMATSVTPTLQTVKFSNLEVAQTTIEQLSEYEAGLKKFVDAKSEAEAELSRASSYLSQLQSLGYPVSKCLTCGELTLTEAIDEKDLGIPSVHTH